MRRQKLIELNKRKIRVISKELALIFIYQLFFYQLFSNQISSFFISSSPLFFLFSYISNKQLFDKIFDINNQPLVKNLIKKEVDLNFARYYYLIIVKVNKVW